MNLTAFLIKNNIEFEFLEKKSTHHAQEASEVSNIPLEKIAKTIVFTDQDSRPLIAIIRADHNVSRHKLQSHSGSKSVRLASEEIAEKATSYPTGGIPPIGHRKKLPVFLDKELLNREYVWCGGGTRTRLVKLKIKDIIRLNDPTICDLQR
jgi:Cys-tRNA(Pro) deacylase